MSQSVDAHFCTEHVRREHVSPGTANCCAMSIRSPADRALHQLTSGVWCVISPYDHLPCPEALRDPVS